MLKTLVAALALLVSLAAAAADPQVEIKTSLGDIVVELDPARAPLTVENFLQYVKARHYDGTLFHRVMPGFMIQGGGFTPDFQEKPAGKPVRNEASNGVPNTVGTIAMARTNEPHSATAQFFINVADNRMLNFRFPTIEGYGYAVFGKVISGMDVVDKIRDVPTGSKPPHDDVPLTPVTNNKATVEK